MSFEFELLNYYKFLSLPEFVLKYFNIVIKVDEGVFVKFIKGKDEVVSNYLVKRENLSNVHKHFTKSSENNYFLIKFKKMLNQKSVTEFESTKRWKTIFKQLGHQISIILLQRCHIVEIQENSLIYLSGNFYCLYQEKKIADENQGKAFVNRDQLFKIQKVLPSISTDKLVYALSNKVHKIILDQHLKKSLYVIAEKISQRYSKIPIEKIFKDFFKNEENFECPVKNIASFLLLLSSKFLQDVFCKSELKKLKGKISLLLMRNKYENLSLYDISLFMSTTKFKLTSFIKNKSSNSAKALFMILQNFLMYLFENIYVEIISFFFYINSSKDLKTKLLFYFNKSWYKKTNPIINNFISRFEPLSKVSKFDYFNKSPNAVLRCVLSKDKFRVVTNCSKLNAFPTSSSISQSNQYYMSINLKSKMLASIIKEITSEINIPLERGNNSVLSILKNYLKIIRKISPEEKLYMLKFDVKNAFDQVDQSTLISLIKNTNLIENNKYYQYKEIKELIYTKYDNNIHFNRKFLGSDKHVRDVTVRNNKDFKNSLISLQKSIEISGKELRKKLIESLSNLYILYNNKRYKMTKGIPQGYNLSTFLYSLYTNHLLKEKMNCVSNGILLQFVDDFLLISTDINVIRSHYNNIINSKKNQLQFNIEKIESNVSLSEGKDENSILSNIKCNEGENDIKNKNSFLWCGYKIYYSEFAIKKVYKKGILPFLVYIRCYKSGRRFKMGIIKKIKKTFKTIALDSQNFFVYQNLFTYILRLLCKVKIGFKRMNFINRNYVKECLSDLIGLLFKLVLRYKICNKDLLLKIIEKALKESNIDKIKKKLCFK